MDLENHQKTPIQNREPLFSSLAHEPLQEVEFDRSILKEFLAYYNSYDIDIRSDDRRLIRAIMEGLREVSDRQLIATLNQSSIQQWQQETLFFAGLWNEFRRRSFLLGDEGSKKPEEAN